MGKGKKRITLAEFEEKKAKAEADNSVIHLSGKPIPFASVVHIYSFLSHHEVKVSSAVNRSFRTLSENQGLWHQLFLGKVKLVFEVESDWKKFFCVDKHEKNTNWRNCFSDLEKYLDRDESFCLVKPAHPSCNDPCSVEERKSRVLSLTGVNGLVFALPGVKTISPCLVFSSSRPSENVQGMIKVWSIGSLSKSPNPLSRNPFDLLHRGIPVGIEGFQHRNNYVIRQLGAREISENVCAMFPVYTFFKEDGNTWEYACICGDEAGKVSFYTGSCVSGTISNGARPATQIFSTSGRVVGLKCMLEEDGFSGFKQAFGCGFNDSGHLYDLQTNKIIADFPHEDGLHTDCMDVSTDAKFFVLGQFVKKNNVQQGVIRLFEMTANGPQLLLNHTVSSGSVRCIKFTGAPSASGDSFMFTSREGLSLWDKQSGKVQLKIQVNFPIDQFCVAGYRTLIACTSGSELLLYDQRRSDKWRLVRRVTHGHHWCARMSCDGNNQNPTSGVLITSGTEGNIRLWHVHQLWRPPEDARKRPPPPRREEAQGKSDSAGRGGRGGRGAGRGRGTFSRKTTENAKGSEAPAENSSNSNAPPAPPAQQSVVTPEESAKTAIQPPASQLQQAHQHRQQSGFRPFQHTRGRGRGPPFHMHRQLSPAEPAPVDGTAPNPGNFNAAPGGAVPERRNPSAPSSRPAFQPSAAAEKLGRQGMGIARPQSNATAFVSAATTTSNTQPSSSSQPSASSTAVSSGAVATNPAQPATTSPTGSQPYRPPRTNASLPSAHTAPAPAPANNPHIHNNYGASRGYQHQMHHQHHHHYPAAPFPVPGRGAVPPPMFPPMMGAPYPYPYYSGMPFYPMPPPMPVPPPQSTAVPSGPQPPVSSPSTEQPPAASASSGPQRGLCAFFNQGTCRYDSRCKHRHVYPNGMEVPTYPDPDPPKEPKGETAANGNDNAATDGPETELASGNDSTQ